MLSKNVLLNWYSSMKKTKKNSNNFWDRTLTLKVKFLHFLTLFDTSPLHQFSKFNNFLWVYWFLVSNFVFPEFKLHNQYCHMPAMSWLAMSQLFSSLLTKFENILFSLRSLPVLESLCCIVIFYRLETLFFNLRLGEASARKVFFKFSANFICILISDLLQYFWFST